MTDGRQYDAESGLYHCRARAYSPDVARFMQQDPAGMVDGPNLYAYCGNEPVGRRDPGGMRWWLSPWRDTTLQGGNVKEPGDDPDMSGWEQTQYDTAISQGYDINRCRRNANYICDMRVRSEFGLPENYELPTWDAAYGLQSLALPREIKLLYRQYYDAKKKCFQNEVSRCMSSHRFGSYLLGLHLGAPWTWNRWRII